MKDLELDQPTRERIERLVKEEYRLHQQPMLADADHLRLREIHFELDRYWDLLRRRRALRDSRQDADQARAQRSPPRRIERRADVEME
jgi:hypothetical protein